MTTVQAARTMAGVWVLVAITLLTLHQATAAPIVNAPWGRIVGVDSVSVSGVIYSAYLAIPYALSPVGELRFAKPVAHPGLEDGQVFNATTLGDQCLQISNSFVSTAAGMSEDCLTLNVYVPVPSISGPKSVMVWIYGGGFLNGGAPTYTPSELVTEDEVIAVVIQYRLGALGFLSSGDDTVPGNMGLWDQNLALHWVKTNIGAFGGNPESMTVFGQSAGAVSAGLQMLSPASMGLTFRVILQSGTPSAPWPINENPSQTFEALAKQTGCLDSVATRRGYFTYIPEAQKRAEREKVLACLRGLEAEELILFGPAQDSTFFSSFVWLPVVDKDFVPRHPVDLISDVTYLDDVGVTKRDVIVGVTNEEGALFLILEEFLLSFSNSTEGRSELIRNLLDVQLIFLFGEDLRKDPQRRRILVNVLEFFYSQVFNNDADKISLQTTSDVVSDTIFNLNAVQFVRDLAKAKAETSSPGRHYLYLFNHFPDLKAVLPELRGTYHGDDLSYLFDPVPELGNRLGFTVVENTIGSTFRTLLASFAQTGQPLLNYQASGVMWPEFTLTTEEYLSVELVPRVDSRLFGSRVALWTDLIPSLINSTRVPKRPRYRIC